MKLLNASISFSVSAGERNRDWRFSHTSRQVAVQSSLRCGGVLQSPWSTLSALGVASTLSLALIRPLYAPRSTPTEMLLTITSSVLI